MSEQLTQFPPETAPELPQIHGTVQILEADLDPCGSPVTLKTTLSALGFDIGEAGNGEEALMRLRITNFEVTCCST